MFGILAGVLATVGVAPSTNVTYKAAGVCIRGIALSSIVAVHIRRSVFLGMHGVGRGGGGERDHEVYGASVCFSWKQGVHG